MSHLQNEDVSNTSVVELIFVTNIMMQKWILIYEQI
jgi:hypothetical protein